MDNPSDKVRQNCRTGGAHENEGQGKACEEVVHDEAI